MSRAGHTGRDVATTRWSTRQSRKAFCLSVPIPVLIWAGTTFLVTSHLFDLPRWICGLSALIAGTTVLTIELLIVVCPPSPLVTRVRVTIALIVALIGSTLLDSILNQREANKELRIEWQTKVEESFEPRLAEAVSLRDAMKTALEETRRAAEAEGNGKGGTIRKGCGSACRQLESRAQALTRTI